LKLKGPRIKSPDIPKGRFGAKYHVPDLISRRQVAKFFRERAKCIDHAAINNFLHPALFVEHALFQTILI